MQHLILATRMYRLLKEDSWITFAVLAVPILVLIMYLVNAEKTKDAGIRRSFPMTTCWHSFLCAELSLCWRTDGWIVLLSSHMPPS
jgi:hypothetical protein